jgi:predicted SAM-dependent methyltransferase
MFIRTLLRNVKRFLQNRWRRMPVGVREAMELSLWEGRTFLVHRIGVLRARRFWKRSGLQLHVGCGPNIKPGWVNIDLKKTADLRLDIREALPFRDGSCAVIYSEHFLEHICYPEPVSAFLRECRRILQPGGVFSVVVPDVDLVLRSYVNGGSEEYYAAQRRWHPQWYTTQMEHVNYNFRQDGEHKYCYDFETLRRLLERCGFERIQRRAFDPTLDSGDRIVGSMYVQCRKPTEEMRSLVITPHILTGEQISNHRVEK